jgi:hypothetical protein
MSCGIGSGLTPPGLDCGSLWTLSLRSRRAKRYWSRFAEPGCGAVDALSVGDWGKSLCPARGKWHQEVIYAFPPSGLIRQVVREATVDMAACVLVVPVATVAPHWSKLVRSPLLSGREAPDGYLRIRTPGSHLRHATSFAPKELAVFVCDFALAGGGESRAGAGVRRLVLARIRPLCGGSEDAADRRRSCWRCGAKP